MRPVLPEPLPDRQEVRKNSSYELVGKGRLSSSEITSSANLELNWGYKSSCQLDPSSRKKSTETFLVPCWQNLLPKLHRPQHSCAVSTRQTLCNGMWRGRCETRFKIRTRIPSSEPSDVHATSRNVGQQSKTYSASAGSICTLLHVIS